MKISTYEGRTYFTGWAGLDLHFAEEPPDGEPKASIVVVHGYGEHLGWYADFLHTLTENGYAAYAFDQRGHGRSEGVRGDVVRFRDFVKDISTFIDYVRDRSSAGKVFLVAHSTGAAAGLIYAAEHPGILSGLVTTGIYVRDAGEYARWKVVLAPLLAKLAPLMPIQELDDNRAALNPQTVRALKEDPLAYHGGVRLRMGLHFLRMERYLDNALGSVSLPLFILHGENDALASVDGSRLLYERAVSSDKRLEVVAGSGHMVLHDYSSADAVKSIVEWLNAHL